MPERIMHLYAFSGIIYCNPSIRVVSSDVHLPENEKTVLNIHTCAKTYTTHKYMC